MNHYRLSAVTSSLTSIPSRRDVLRGLVGAGFGLGVARFPSYAEAKKRKKKPKGRQSLCRKDGSACKKPGKQCKPRYCLNAPFTIEAKWTGDPDHDTHLFVPPQDGTTGPAPYIRQDCNPSNSACEGGYPFACVSKDAVGPGDEVTTIHRLLPGTYEYWIELDYSTPAGNLTIILKDSTGRVVREWVNPANPNTVQAGWHVFDFDGKDGRVTAFDELIDERPPDGAHDPNTDVCPSDT